MADNNSRNIFVLDLLNQVVNQSKSNSKQRSRQSLFWSCWWDKEISLSSCFFFLQWLHDILKLHIKKTTTNKGKKSKDNKLMQRSETITNKEINWFLILSSWNQSRTGKLCVQHLKKKIKNCQGISRGKKISTAITLRPNSHSFLQTEGCIDIMSNILKWQSECTLPILVKKSLVNDRTQTQRIIYCSAIIEPDILISKLSNLPWQILTDLF